MKELGGQEVALGTLRPPMGLEPGHSSWERWGVMPGAEGPSSYSQPFSKRLVKSHMIKTQPETGELPNFLLTLDLGGWETSLWPCSFALAQVSLCAALEAPFISTTANQNTVSPGSHYAVYSRERGGFAERQTWL